MINRYNEWELLSTLIKNKNFSESSHITTAPLERSRNFKQWLVDSENLVTKFTITRSSTTWAAAVRCCTAYKDDSTLYTSNAKCRKIMERNNYIGIGPFSLNQSYLVFFLFISTVHSEYKIQKNNWFEEVCSLPLLKSFCLIKGQGIIF